MQIKNYKAGGLFHEAKPNFCRFSIFRFSLSP
jgi:hypothetical protein